MANEAMATNGNPQIPSDFESRTMDIVAKIIQGKAHDFVIVASDEAGIDLVVSRKWECVGLCEYVIQSIKRPTK